MSSTNQPLIQVVPKLQPGRCGVSDHAISLAGELDAGFGIGTAFVALSPSAPGDLPFPVTNCTADGLLDACMALNAGQRGMMLVHLSGYGYSPDGIPARLAAALNDVKAGGRFKVAVYFHELFAVGPPWRSAFWHSHRQQAAVREIARLCDLAVTNTGRHAAWLKQQLGPSSADLLKVLPVFSTVGEARELAPFARRDPVLSVFGLPGTRLKAYHQLRALGKMLEDLGIRQIIDIGPACEPPSHLHGIAVKRLGELSTADLGCMLSACMFGFVPHPSFCLAKSSVFAACCAHGAIPVVPESFHGEVDGLGDGVHVVSPATAARAKKSGWEHCSLAAWRWYCDHRLRVHAETYWQWLNAPSIEDENRACAVTGSGEA
jgi:hypothetical protein